MRRRQAANEDGITNDGIFILGGASDDGKHKYSRQRKNVNSLLLLSFGILIVIALYGAVQPTSRTGEISSSGVNIDKNSNPSASSSKAISDSDSAKAVKNNDGNNKVEIPETPATTSFEPPRIPRRLIFTYKYNLIAPSDSDPPFNPTDPLTANVLKTIDKYQKFWKMKDNKQYLQDKEEEKKKGEDVVVSFLSDDNCREVITKAEPRLLNHFNEEARGEFKADICRVAELYVYGGYYFDIDIGVVKPLEFDAFSLPTQTPDPIFQLNRLKRNKFKEEVGEKDDIVTFATVYNRQGRFFQAFTAAMPQHPVLKRSLEYMIYYYEGTLEKNLPKFILDSMKLQNQKVPSRKKPYGMGVGPYTLSVSHRSTSDEDWEGYVNNLMKESGYTSNLANVSTDVPAKRRYSRFLYEVSLEDEEVLSVGIFRHIPLQDADYVKKIRWCNYICFGGKTVYFYSRVPGSKGCPLEKK